MSSPAAVEAARRIIAQLDADEPIDWHAEASATGLTVYRLQLLVRHQSRPDGLMRDGQ